MAPFSFLLRCVILRRLVWHYFRLARQFAAQVSTCQGDAVNAILAAVGHNLRLLASWLSLFVVWIKLWNARNDQSSGPLTA